MNLQDLHDQLEKHTNSDQLFQEKIGDDVSKILNNHLAHIEPDVAVIKFQIKILLGCAGAILVAIVGLALK